MNELTVIIPMDRYVKLIEAETKLGIIERKALRDRYGVDNGFIQLVLGKEDETVNPSHKLPTLESTVTAMENGAI